MWHLRTHSRKRECYGCIEPDVFAMLEIAFRLRLLHNEPGGYRIGG